MDVTLLEGEADLRKGVAKASGSMCDARRQRQRRTHQQRDVVGELQRDLACERCRLGEVEQVLERERERDTLLQVNHDPSVLVLARLSLLQIAKKRTSVVSDEARETRAKLETHLCLLLLGRRGRSSVCLTLLERRLRVDVVVLLDFCRTPRQARTYQQD